MPIRSILGGEVASVSQFFTGRAGVICSLSLGATKTLENGRSVQFWTEARGALMLGSKDSFGQTNKKSIGIVACLEYCAPRRILAPREPVSCARSTKVDVEKPLFNAKMARRLHPQLGHAGVLHAHVTEFG